tara:strand:- start:42956 stop:43873 length:918 start_codon:yes stop_codon:yes gene_type:complete
MRWAASNEIVEGGLQTGIAVSPVMWRTPMAFAMTGGAISHMTNGKFIMGIGAGGAYRPDVRKSIGLPKMSALALMRDYITIIKELVNEGKTDYEGEVGVMKGGRMSINPLPATPVYLGALGPKMLQLAGELADGAALNWCAPEQVAWSREKIVEGAEKVGRDPSEIKISEYIRICVDENEDKARIALAKATMHYALGATVPTEKERSFGYRAHFERMGFTSELADLDEMRKKGASRDEVADAFPVDLLRTVGYFGSAKNAAAEFARISKGLDHTIVRVVSSRPGTIEGTLDVMKACAPDKVRPKL